MKRALVIASSVLALAVLAAAIWRFRPLRADYYTDAESIKVPADAAPLRDILWQPPTELPLPLNTSGDDYEPRLSADGLTLYFVRGKAGNNADIYESRRTPEGWTDPVPVDGINSDADDLGPEPSVDGTALYFYSNREGGLGGYDLWVSRSTEHAWAPPTNLGPLVNSEFNDYGPALTADGAAVYFSSNRPLEGDDKQPDPNAWPATLREDLFHRTYDLYAAAVTERGMSAAVPLAALNTPRNEGAPAVSPFGDFLYFASDREGGQGGFDLYRTRRLRGDYVAAENLGSAVNTKANELDPGLTLGGYALYFSSDRPVASGEPNETSLAQSEQHQPRDYNLYQTTSREVFAETQSRERPPFDWAGLWTAIGPNLLWALLALLLLLAMLALFRSARERKMSLLAKCLLASMAAHLLLLLLLNAWEVAATIAGEFNRRGRIQIALAAPISDNAIAGQLLSALTEVTPPAPSLELSQRTVEPPPAATSEPVDAKIAIKRRPIEWTAGPAANLETTEAQPADAPLEAPSIELADSPSPPAEPVSARLPSESRPIQATEADALSEVRPAEAAPAPRPEIPPPSSQQMTPVAALAPSSPPAIKTPPAPLPATAPMAIEATPSTVLDSAQSMLRREDPPIAEAEWVIPALPLDHAPQAAVQSESRSTPTVLAVKTAVSRPELAKAASLEAQAIHRVQLDRPKNTAPTGHESLVPENLPATSPREQTPSAPEWKITPPEAIAASPPDQEIELAVPAAKAARVPHAEAAPEPPMAAEPSARRFDVQPRHDSAAAQAKLAPERNTERLAQLDQRQTARLIDAVEAPLQAAPQSNDRLDLAETVEIAQATVSQIALPTAKAAPARTAESTEFPGITLGAPTHASRAPVLLASPEPSAIDTPNIAIPKTPKSAQDSTLASSILASTAPLAHPDPVAPWLLPDATPPVPSTSFSTVNLTLPVDEIPPDRPLMQRFADDRLEMARRMGGNEDTERAVELALKWLAAHQSADGRWDADGFESGCGQCGGVTEVVADNALTGLSLMCFLGAGHTHSRPGPYQDNVRRGLDWLLSRQAGNGDLRTDETMYSHGIATIALSESYAMTGDGRLADPVQRAVRFIDRARNKSAGGWRYDPGQEGDTSVLGWQVMALKSAQMAGVDVPSAPFRSAREWLNKVRDRAQPGLYSYQPGSGATPSMTAEAMFTQLLLGLEPRDPALRGSADYILDHLPDWDEDPNTYFWYYASLALLQHQGPKWDRWNEAVSRELVEHQRRDGRATGSWDPVGEWAEVGGRVYQTAICTLILEVYYRYLPLYSPDQSIRADDLPEDVIGALRGTVRDARTQAPLAGATVRLSLSDQPEIIVTTDPDGRYILNSPEVPDHFALSAAAAGYVPSTQSLERERLDGHIIEADFQLDRLDEGVVVIEAEPQVHHLGDDRFSGEINSQFQKQSQGAHFSTVFNLSESQIGPGITSGEVVLLVKGVQRDHRIVINGTTLDQRLNEAPQDGGFGEFAAAFEPTLLRSGENTLEIIAAPSSSDIDDFEFVNIRIRLLP